MINCGYCKGEKKVKSTKRKRTPDKICSICKGTGESAILFDMKNKPIIPGVLAKTVPDKIKKDSGETKRPASYKGTVLYVYEDEGGGVVQIQADPNLAFASEKSKNHGYRAARPNKIKIIKGTEQSKRIARYLKKLKENK